MRHRLVEGNPRGTLASCSARGGGRPCRLWRPAPGCDCLAGVLAVHLRSQWVHISDTQWHSASQHEMLNLSDTSLPLYSVPRDIAKQKRWQRKTKTQCSFGRCLSDFLVGAGASSSINSPSRLTENKAAAPCILYLQCPDSVQVLTRSRPSDLPANVALG